MKNSVMKCVKRSIVALAVAAFGLTALSATAQAGKDDVLKMALLPIPDVLPVYVAMDQGYFDELGVSVKVLPVGSAMERDQLMQAGQVDGLINELSGTAGFNRDGARVQIVSIARSPMEGAPLFRVVAAPKSGLTDVSQLGGVPIGISVNTVIEYITGQLLLGGGVAAENISYTSIPVLPERLQLLLSGQVQAVTLPDPLGAAAIAGGGIEIINDTVLGSVSSSVVSFATSATKGKRDAVKGFMKAWDKACAAINADPKAFQPLMLKKIRVPKNVQATFLPPKMPRKQLPSKAEWDQAMAWMVGKELIKSPLAYEESVTAEFLAD